MHKDPRFGGPPLKYYKRSVGTLSVHLGWFGDVLVGSQT